MLFRFLIYLFYFLSGFAILPWTKVRSLGDIQSFVIVAIVIVAIGIFYAPKYMKCGNAEKAYIVFLISSLPALFIGLSYGKTDSIYFYIYTLLPILLLRQTYSMKINFSRALLFAELSLLLVIAIGWGIRLEYLPMTFLNNDVIESEFKLGYWGISYVQSTRNHDYMYVLSCAAISLCLRNRTTNLFVKGLHVFIFFICEITLLASLSRGAMLICLLYLVVFYLTSDKMEQIVFHIPLLCTIFYLLPSIIKEYDTTYRLIFNSIFDDSAVNMYGNNFSNQNRWDIYSNALKKILLNPIGYGIQNFAAITKGVGGSAENAYLTVFVERGWLAGFSFICFLLFQYVKKPLFSLLETKRLNTYLIPALVIYFLFNYEFMSYSNVFLFYLILVSDKYVPVNRKKIVLKEHQI